MIEFISTSVTSSLNHTYYSTIADLHNLQFTVSHYEVFLLCFLQSVWNLGTKHFSGLTPPAYD
jgi:hypothetical protein